MNVDSETNKQGAELKHRVLRFFENYGAHLSDFKPEDAENESNWRYKSDEYKSFALYKKTTITSLVVVTEFILEKEVDCDCYETLCEVALVSRDRSDCDNNNKDNVFCSTFYNCEGRIISDEYFSYDVELLERACRWLTFFKLTNG